jgi:hypothetical protein
VEELQLYVRDQFYILKLLNFKIIFHLLLDILFYRITNTIYDKEQNILILLQSTKAVSSKNATCLDVSQDKFAFKGSRFRLFIYL